MNIRKAVSWPFVCRFAAPHSAPGHTSRHHHYGWWQTILPMATIKAVTLCSLPPSRQSVKRLARETVSHNITYHVLGLQRPGLVRRVLSAVIRQLEVVHVLQAPHLNTHTGGCNTYVHIATHVDFYSLSPGTQSRVCRPVLWPSFLLRAPLLPSCRRSHPLSSSGSWQVRLLPGEPPAERDAFFSHMHCRLMMVIGTTPFILMRMRVYEGYFSAGFCLRFQFSSRHLRIRMHFPARKAWPLCLAVIWSLLNCSISLQGANAANRRSCAVRLRSGGGSQVADKIAARNGFRNLGKVRKNTHGEIFSK